MSEMPTAELNAASDQKTANGSSRLESILKIVTALVAISGAIAGFVNIMATARINADAARVSADNARIAADNSRRDTQKPYVDLMLPVYKEMIVQTEKIASVADIPDGIKPDTTSRFHEMYGGEVRLFASEEVNQRINDFETLLKDMDFQTHDKKTLDGNSVRLGGASIALARAMHRQIASMTGVPQ